MQVALWRKNDKIKCRRRVDKNKLKIDLAK